MITDPVADMLTIIRNGLKVNKKEVVVKSSKLNKSILEILKRDGYIEGFQEFSEKTVKGELGKKLRLQIFLKYYKDVPVITHIEKISKPGRRVYIKADEINPVKNGLGIAIISTSKGLVTDKEAKKYGIGGELLSVVW